MNVPQLRFKEFSGEWEVKKLGDIFTFKNGVNASKEQYGSGYKFINVLDIINNNFITYEKIIGSVNISEDEFIKNEVKFGDVLFQRSSETREEVGQSNVYIGHQSVTFGGFVIRGRGITEYSPSFFNYVLKTSSIRDEITQRSGGSTRYNVGQNSLSVVPAVLPSIPEQIKIANFLTAVDEKIAQLTKKCDLLAQYKKGVMQQIFSQQLRFKDEDVRDFPEWEEKKFGDVFSFIATNSFSRALLTFDDGLVKNIHYGDIHKNFKSNFKIENENVPFINQEVDINKIQKDCYCKEGDLIIADASEDYADIGKSIEIISLDNQKLLAGLHTYIARDLLKQMALGFSGYLMQTESVRLQIKTLATGVSVLGISKGNLAKVNLNVPSKPEQTKIANFLTAIDDKITQAQAQLAAVKQYKRGLLQQMFV